MAEKQLTGKVPREAIVMLAIPRYAPEIIEGYRNLSDLTGTVSDAMDELGLAGAVPGSVLKPTLPGSKTIGPALTLRNIEQREQPYKGAQNRTSRMAEIEAHNLAQAGDVLVIEGIDGISNMGGISATIAKRQGEIAAIVDGGIRDVEQSRSIGFPLWSRSISSITGKWRLQTVAINGPVRIAGVQVNPGDLVVADDGGICFIPRDMVEAVLKRAREISEGEARRYADIAAGVSVPELAKKTHVYKFER
ncbi:MAG: RraA family protein [Betaproteobacteria bacterium]|nr:MAG: RraA family protein [Betaproteobacteria bacterium]